MQALARGARSLWRPCEAPRRLFGDDAWRPSPGFWEEGGASSPPPEASGARPSEPPEPQPVPPLRLLATSGDLAFFAKPAGMESFIAQPSWRRTPPRSHDIELRYANVVACEMMGAKMYEVNHIEKGMSGVLVLSSTNKGAQLLRSVWTNAAAVRREFVALVAGSPAAEEWSNLTALRHTRLLPAGLLTQPHWYRRREGYKPPPPPKARKGEEYPLQKARTDFRVLARFPRAPDALSYRTALVEAAPLTSRHQQVRKHLKLNRHRVVGDPQDGHVRMEAHRRNVEAEKLFGLGRIFLHGASVTLSRSAFKAMGMPRKDDQAMRVVAPLPADLRHMLERLPGWPAAAAALRERGLISDDDAPAG